MAIIIVRYSLFGTRASLQACRGQSTTDWFRHCHPTYHGPRRSLRKSAPWTWTCAPVVFFGTRFEVSRISRQKWCQQALLAEGKSSDARARHNRTGWAVEPQKRLHEQVAVLLPCGAHQVSRHIESVECFWRRRRSCWVVPTRTVESFASITPSCTREPESRSGKWPWRW